MKILVLNTIYGTGSTGKISKALAEEYASKDDEVRYAYGRVDYVPDRLWCEAYRIGSAFECKMHAVLTRIFDWHGTGICSYFGTKRFLRWADGYNPDVLWLHNLHGYYINYPMLFKWIKSRPQMKVMWMLHDCWSFTGHCSHYTSTGCQQYKSSCAHCPQRGDYPASKFFSNSKRNLHSKKEAFLGCPNLTFYISSKWLANQVSGGFLGGKYPIVMRPYTLNREVFHPTPSNVRDKLKLGDKKMILCVASQWDDKKGIQDVLELSRLISDEWRIVMVGLEKRQISILPDNIIGIERTHNQQELAELYSAADWFFNPTHEDIYSMTNMEAAGCGCKVVSYDTGGAPEAVEGYDKAVLLHDHSAVAAWEVIKA